MISGVKSSAINFQIALNLKWSNFWQRFFGLKSTNIAEQF